jgi:hypothetical protein
LDDFNKCIFSCQTGNDNNTEMLFLPFLYKKGALGKTAGIKKERDLRLAADGARLETGPSSPVP